MYFRQNVEQIYIRAVVGARLWEMKTKEPGENLPMWILCNEKEQFKNMIGQNFDLLFIQIQE